MMNPNFLTGNLFEKIFELNSKSKIGATTITVFTFILYKCEDPQKKIVLSDYEMARELGLSRQTVITAKNKLKLLGLLEYKRNPGFPNRFILNGNEFPNEKLKIYEIKEIPAEKFNPIQSPKNVASNSQSKHPTLMQFMDFAKTLKDYSEKFDDWLIKKFHQWENSDWNNTLGRPILNWQSVLQKNMIMFDSHRNFENNSALKIPEIKRPKLD